MNNIYTFHLKVEEIYMKFIFPVIEKIFYLKFFAAHSLFVTFAFTVLKKTKNNIHTHKKRKSLICFRLTLEK